MSNIHTLWSNKKEDDKKKADVEEFSQGGQQSHTAVMRPVRRDVTPSDVIGAARQSAAAAGSDAKLDTGLTITMYRNGFLLGDNDFRPINKPENQGFLRALHNREMPPELERDIIARHGLTVEEASVAIVDKSSEDYTPPPQPFDFSSSKGQSLSDGNESLDAAANFANLTPKAYEVNPSEPTITVQLVLLPRQRVRVQFNTSATVGDVYRHMRHLSGIDKFEMLVRMSGSPALALYRILPSMLPRQESFL